MRRGAEGSLQRAEFRSICSVEDERASAPGTEEHVLLSAGVLLLRVHFFLLV